MIRQTPFFIVSTHRTDKPIDVNQLTTADELASLGQRGKFNKLVKGVFNGVSEDAIVIHDRDEAM